MLGDLKKVSVKLGLGFWGLGLFCVSVDALAATAIDNTPFAKFVGELSYRASQQDAQIQAINSNRDRINDSNDRRLIENYYNQTRAHYISDPTRSILNSVKAEQSLDSYISTLEGSFSSRASSLEIAKIEAKETKNVAALKDLGFQECMANSLNFSNLHSKKSLVVNSLDALQIAVDTPYTFRSMDRNREGRWAGRNNLSNGLAAFSQDIPALSKNCCKKANIEDARCQELSQPAIAAQDELYAQFNGIDYPTPRYTPNPLEIQELTSQELTQIISQKNATLRSLRNGSSDKDYHDEQSVFEDTARCRVRASQFQGTKKPLSFQAAFAAAKAVKCALLPAYAAQNLDTEWAKVSVAGVAVPIEGQGWDINCGANEAQAWNQIIDQTRDPRAWGLDQMANPPYIESLRSLPPVATGLPMNGMTADDYMMLTPSPGLDNYSVGVNNKRTTANPKNSSSRGRSSSGRNTLSNKAVRSNSGVNRGQELVGATRSASSSIRNNDRASFYANRLSLGAQNTQKFLSTGVTRSKLLNRSTSSTSTDDVRRMVLRSTGTRASRTTGEGILGSITRNGTENNSGTGNIRDIGAENEAVRAEVKATVQKMLDNIELTRVKAEAARMEIAKLTGDYDTVAAEIVMDVEGKAPKKIAARIKEGNVERKAIITELGVQRATFDALQAQILEQSSALNRLVTFGPMDNNLKTGVGGRGSNTGSTGATLPAGLDASGRGTTRGAWNRKTEWIDQMWSMLNPIATAWAATKTSGQDFERFYASEWARFKKQYREYVEGLRRSDQGNAREAAQLIASRKKLITPENYDLIDLDTLTSIDMFLSELDTETEFLLEGHRNKQFKLSNEVVGKIQEARENTLKAQESLVEAHLVSFKLRPKSYEQDPDLWWGFVPEILLE